MKLTAHIPTNVRLSDVVAAMRSLGLDLKYRDGELIAGNPEQHGNGNVLRFPAIRQFLPMDWPGKPAA